MGRCPTCGHVAVEYTSEGEAYLDAALEVMYGEDHADDCLCDERIGIDGDGLFYRDGRRLEVDDDG